MTETKINDWPAESLALQKCSLKVRKFQCFQGQAHGLEEIKPLNIIVGRNNSGKTALLKAILYAFRRAKSTNDLLSLDCELEIGRIIDSDALTKLPDDLSTVKVDNQSRTYKKSNIGRHLLGTRVCISLSGGDSKFAGAKEEDDPFLHQMIVRTVEQLSSWIKSPLTYWKVCSISSERDIRPELALQENGEIAKDSSLDSFGNGLTRLFHSLMYSAESNRLDLIENVLVPAMNEILFPDNQYERVLMRVDKDDKWEIFLDEKSKKLPIPLSNTGSGIKTVLLVLANLLILPRLQSDTKRHEFVFAFEELENNLHPATLRRLFKYISEYCLKHRCFFFITTHSHIVIDMFSNDANAQILHVEHNGQHAYVRTIRNRIDGSNVLKDLDVRASDLLQTNVVIWVEGPTDAMFIERWIDIHSDEKLRRGIDYQCVCYGGSTGSHMTFDTENTNKLIEATKICRHSIFLADSNRKNSESQVCKHTQLIAKEVEETGGIGWITHGREIENYLPIDVVSRAANAELKSVNPYTDLYEKIKKLRNNTTEMQKIVLANRVIPNLSKDNIYRHDLKERIEEVCMRIAKWNGKA